MNYHKTIIIEIDDQRINNCYKIKLNFINSKQTMKFKTNNKKNILLVSYNLYLILLIIILS